MAGNLEGAQDNNKTGGGEMDFTYDRLQIEGATMECCMKY